ncbi:type II secretion system protein GspM [Thermovibrio sp.]
MELSKLKEEVSGYLSSLSQRERLTLLLGVPLLVVILYFLVFLLPLLNETQDYLKRQELLLRNLENLKPQLKELLQLKEEISPVMDKLKRGKSLDVASYVKTVGRMVGLNVSSVKVAPASLQEGIEVDRVSVGFSEVPLNKVSMLIFKLENGSYYFKSDSISLSDYDQNGLVSGKVILYFFRSKE